MIQATPEQVDAVIEHMLGYTPSKRDWRPEVRAMEAEIFDVLGGSPWPAFLVGNQALDFKKQDGVTEIEESVQAPPAHLPTTLSLEWPRGPLRLDPRAQR